MAGFLRRNLLILCLAAATLLALLLPALGQYLGRWEINPPLLRALLPDFGIIQAGVVVIFICQGASLNLTVGLHLGHQARALGLGAVVAHVMAPFLGWLTVLVLGWQDDARVGFVLMCCMAPTLASGIIIAVQANGNRLAAVLLTVGLNLVSIVAIPINLGWTLGSEAGVDRGGLLVKLLLLILIPAIAGQALRRSYPKVAVNHPTLLQVLPILALSLTVFIALAAQVDKVRQISPLMLLRFVLPALAVHLLCFAAAYGGALLLALPLDVRRSLAIVSSQKTLPVAIAIWSTAFANFPYAILPCIVFHLSQIYCDGFIAKRMAERSPVPAPVPA